MPNTKNSGGNDSEEEEGHVEGNRTSDATTTAAMDAAPICDIDTAVSVSVCPSKCSEPSLGSARVRVGTTATAISTDRLCRQEIEDKIKQFLDGELCIDSRFMGNIGRFIKHRASKSNSATGQLSSSSPLVHSDTQSIDGIANQSKIHTQQAAPMLIRRLVYSDAGNYRYPKLALFATQMIPANTELVL